jgi:hypothetical protein
MVAAHDPFDIFRKGAQGQPPCPSEGSSERGEEGRVASTRRAAPANYLVRPPAGRLGKMTKPHVPVVVALTTAPTTVAAEHSGQHFAAANGTLFLLTLLHLVPFLTLQLSCFY